ncbi:pepsin/retropepsin-like aspartic protease family protein [Sphingomicrobium arenosum]|uniref:hypothetical protein n=1 Tax=Sphingomicrobium arenosum TaxID=2233861 RepID=UPI00224032F3|nr:hypothetical protein [Sphingomicrobium arenosum]
MSLLIAGAFLTLVADRPCAASHLPLFEPPAEVLHIPLFFSDRRILVSGRLGDGVRFPTLFDTASSGNLVSMRLARREGLIDYGASKSVDGGGNPVPGFDTCLPDFTVDGVAIPFKRATVLDYDRENEAILSPMSFAGARLLFDGPASRLTILPDDGTPPPSDAAEWEGEEGDAHPATMLEIGDVRLKSTLDTGSDTAVILPLREVSRFDYVTPPERAGWIRFAADHRLAAYDAKLKGTMRVGGALLVDPDVTFADIDVPLIGFPVMRQMRFIMDPEARLSWPAPE